MKFVIYLVGKILANFLVFFLSFFLPQSHFSFCFRNSLCLFSLSFPLLFLYFSSLFMFLFGSVKLGMENGRATGVAFINLGFGLLG